MSCGTFFIKSSGLHQGRNNFLYDLIKQFDETGSFDDA